MLIENIKLKNIEIIYPGGGNPNYAYRGVSKDDLAGIPEMKDAYPEFSQFKELPAWGFFIKYAKNISFENVKLIALATDYRPSVVLDNVMGYTINRLDIKENSKRSKKQIIVNNSTK